VFRTVLVKNQVCWDLIPYILVLTGVNVTEEFAIHSRQNTCMEAVDSSKTLVYLWEYAVWEHLYAGSRYDDSNCTNIVVWGFVKKLAMITECLIFSCWTVQDPLCGRFSCCLLTAAEGAVLLEISWGATYWGLCISSGIFFPGCFRHEVLKINNQKLIKHCVSESG